MKQWLWAVAGAIALAGCAGSGERKAGDFGAVQVQEDSVQRSKTVQLAPQAMDCGRVAHCPTLGARWSSANPNRAVLLLGTWGGQAAVQGIEFHVRPHAPMRVRSLSREASGLPGVIALDVPMATLERVAFGKGGWVRVSTDGAYIEENLYTGERSSPAADGLKRFVYEAYKGTDKEFTPGILGLFTDKDYAPNHGK